MESGPDYTGGVRNKKSPNAEFLYEYRNFHFRLTNLLYYVLWEKNRDYAQKTHEIYKG